MLEPDSPAALALRKRVRPPCPLTPLHRLELRSAWRLKAFRREMPAAFAAAAWNDLQADIAAGVWMRPLLDLSAAFESADELADEHSATLGTRSLDVLHVAIAIGLESKSFITADERQAKLAKAAGLKVLTLK